MQYASAHYNLRIEMNMNDTTYYIQDVSPYAFAHSAWRETSASAGHEQSSRPLLWKSAQCHRQDFLLNVVT